MVVDDDADDRLFFCKALTKTTRINCLRAASGKDAIEFLTEQNNPVPQLIFLDINMPIMTGWEFLTKRRSDQRLKNIPVIMFSTSANQRDVDIAYDLGAFGYCVKPDDPADLENVLRYIDQNINKTFNTDLLQQSGNKFFRFPVAA